MRRVGLVSGPSFARLALGRVGPQPGPSQPSNSTNHPSTQQIAGRIAINIRSLGHFRLFTTCSSSWRCTIDPAQCSSPSLVEADPAVGRSRWSSTAATQSAGTHIQAESSTRSSSFRLRPYQVHCVESVLNALRDGYTRIGVSAPTGKSTINNTTKTRLYTASCDRTDPHRHTRVADHQAAARL